MSEENKNQNNYPMHWAFTSVKNVIAQHGEQELYTCASGITPSGVIHIGNFREAITVDLVKRAFKIMNHNVRHIHSWDDFDVFRKVPKNMPNPEILEKHLRMSIIDTPDTTGKGKNYADKNRIAVETTLPLVGINPEYKYQAEKYRNCDYADDIKKALENKETIREILDKFRQEPLKDDWLPTSIFCDSCKKDTITKQEYKGEYNVYYECECGHKEEFDFRKKGIIKLAWRTDWPMRWNYENVNFEPGGKDHSSPGSSYTTGKMISEQVWNKKAPAYTMYDFIRIKGGSGKISSSSGDVVTLKECLEIYEPEIVRYIFAGTRPNTEFAISFDQDVIKIYEDFDKVERIFYKVDEANEKNYEKNKWIYILSQVNEDQELIPPEMPVQVSFRELTTMLCIKDQDESRVLSHYMDIGIIKNKVDESRLSTRISCAKNWLNKYAEDNFKFIVKSEKDEEFFNGLDENGKKVLTKLKEILESDLTGDEFETAIFNIHKEMDIEMKEFFPICYQAIIGKDRGPKLAGFIEEIGKEKVAKLL